MSSTKEAEKLFERFVVAGDHAASDYFGLIKKLVAQKSALDYENAMLWHKQIETAYALVFDEICTNTNAPVEPIKFGTSGWRGTLGKDVFVGSVACVTSAIINMYREAESNQELLELLGVESLVDAQLRGCVLGFDNRFGGPVLGGVVAKVLTDAGFKVHYGGETTTGVLSAAVIELKAAFSVNLTPSHNPLEYGGYKYNAADGGPAASYITETITANARRLVDEQSVNISGCNDIETLSLPGCSSLDSLGCWKDLVRKNRAVHGLSLDEIITGFGDNQDMVVAIDSVHGASRLHIPELFDGQGSERLITLRDSTDVTFGGIAPEPSSTNIAGVKAALMSRAEPLKIGAIIDPDGDRIRFTDGENEISMNQFGAMAYHFLVVHKQKKGMVAKTVATSNMANRLAEAFDQELFEPRVGFKEFKPVIGRALVFFEESDGVSIIGHTPEKDAYIGLLLALDMVLTTGKNLNVYKKEIEEQYGAYYPDRDGITVKVKGDKLLAKLAGLEKYGVGSEVSIGGQKKSITQVITIDGRKMILSDGSWIMIRPSGTEPKVRFYVESRDEKGTVDLVDAARSMLSEIGLI